MKLNFNGSAIKELALHHGEKVGVALVGVFVLYLIYQAVGIDSLDANAPTTLSDLAGQAMENITQASYTKTIEGEQLDIPTMELVDAELWQISVPLDPDLWPPSSQREDPQLFAAERLEVSSDFGPLAMINPDARELAASELVDAEKLIEEQAADERDVRTVHLRGLSKQRGVQPRRGDILEGKSWVVVTALVPLQKQRAEYDRVFQNAERRKPSDGAPSYYAYVVQRADVTDGGEPDWKRIKAVQESSLQKDTAEYSGQALKVADPRYLDPRVLSWPLPSLVGRDFGAQVVHSAIPHAPTREQLLQERRDEAAKAEEGTVDGGDNAERDEGELFEAPEGGDAFGVRRRGRVDPGGGFGRGRGRGFEGLGGGRPDMGKRIPSQIRRGAGRERVMPGGNRDGGAYARVPYLLFRFFDFNVTQGRRYQYRVRLVLRDPNSQVDPRYLTREVVDRRSAMRPNQRFRRFADWSEASAPIAVPFAGRLVAGPATAALPKKLGGEPKVTVLIKTFDQGKAATAATELVDYVRGTVGNITASIEILKLIEGTLERIENYRFTTESSILDIRGGKKLSKNNNESLTAPGHILVLTRTGKLVVQSELIEEMEYDEYRELFEEDESRDPMRGELDRSKQPTGRPGRGGQGLFGRE